MWEAQAADATKQGQKIAHTNKHAVRSPTYEIINRKVSLSVSLRAYILIIVGHPRARIERKSHQRALPLFLVFFSGLGHSRNFATKRGCNSSAPSYRRSSIRPVEEMGQKCQFGALFQSWASEVTIVTEIAFRNSK